jgi:hypothetical protein
MGSSVIAYTIIIMVIGGYVGWHVRQARGAHGDIKTYKGRIPALRKVRLKSAALSGGIVIVVLLAVRALIH